MRFSRTNSPKQGKRILRYEILEEKLLLKAGPLDPILAAFPELRLVDRDASKLTGQVFYLDFDGATNVDYNGPIHATLSVPSFGSSAIVSSADRSQSIAQIAFDLNGLFNRIGVSFVTALPAKVGAYSTIYVGGSDRVFASFGSFFGLAEDVDVGNVHHADSGLVFSESIAAAGYTGTAFVSEVKDVIGHEALHLLGFEHLNAGENQEGGPLADVALYNESGTINPSNELSTSYTKAVGIVKTSTGTEGTGALIGRAMDIFGGPDTSDSSWVITAAHVVADAFSYGQSVFFYVGGFQQNSSSSGHDGRGLSPILVDQIVINPVYLNGPLPNGSSETAPYDVALLHLTTSVPYAVALHLTYGGTDPAAGSPITLVGFGRHDNLDANAPGGQPGIKRWGTNVIAPIPPNVDILFSDLGVAAGHGDSGGPWVQYVVRKQVGPTGQLERVSVYNIVAITHGPGGPSFFGDADYGPSITYDPMENWIQNVTGIPPSDRLPKVRTAFGGGQVDPNLYTGLGLDSINPMSLTGSLSNPASGVVASFSDDRNLPESAYSASIDWGDGSISTGTIAYDGDFEYTVTGSHLYATGGPHNVVTTINGVNGESTVGAAIASIDGTLPTITAPIGNVVVEQDRSDGAIVDFAVSVWDEFDENPIVTIDHPSGSVFPVGTTNVLVTATNSVGNTASKSFNVVVTGTPEIAGFAPAASYPIGRSGITMVIGDFDEDGFPDVAEANYNNSSVSVQLNGKNRTFAPSSIYTTGFRPNSLIATDVNHDKHLDLVTVDFGGNIDVLLGNGTGIFSSSAIVTPNVSGFLAPDRMYNGDFNGDGIPDLVMHSPTIFDANPIQVWLGNGDGTFRFAPAPSFPLYDGFSNSVGVGDYNQDTRDDLVLYVGTTLYVFQGNANGTFTQINSIANVPFADQIVSKDVDGDGLIDLMVGDVFSSQNRIGIYLGNGDGTFKPAVFYEAVGDRFAVGDTNLDGRLDFSVANGQFIQLFRGKLGGGFEAPLTFPFDGGSFAWGTYALADFDRDGAPDFASVSGSNLIINYNITNAPLTSVHGGSFSSQEGIPIFFGVLAQFSDPNTNAVATDYTVTIDWGDGSTSPATTVKPDGFGGFFVAGSHTYLEAGDFAISAIIDDAGHAAIAHSWTTVTNTPPSINDDELHFDSGPLLDGKLATLNGTFEDPSTLENHLVSINWGDGSLVDYVTLQGGQRTFSASHTYAFSGVFRASAVVTDYRDEAAASISFTVNPAADYDRNGEVDIADYVLWRHMAGASGLLPYTAADGNGDGKIDENDYAVWRSEFGRYSDDHGQSTVAASQLVLDIPAGGNIEVPDDVDWFQFDPSEGATYVFKTELGTLGGSVLRIIGSDGETELAIGTSTTLGEGALINWTAPSAGSYFIEVGGAGGGHGTYSLSASMPLTDGGDSAATATALPVPAGINGTLKTPLDHDWFSFAATAGTSYLLRTVPGTVEEVVVTVVDKDGNTTLYVDDNPNHDEGSAILWTALTDGTYYVVISTDDFSGTGSYGLSITQPPADDVGNYHGTATPLVVPGVVTQSLDFAGDVDWYSFTAVAGTHYEFATSLGTLPDSILRLYDTDGVTQLAFNDDTGGGSASLISWVAPSSGTYFVEVSGYRLSIGSYSLTSIIDSGPGSDLLDTAESADRFGKNQIEGQSWKALASTAISQCDQLQRDIAMMAWLESRNGKSAMLIHVSDFGEQDAAFADSQDRILRSVNADTPAGHASTASPDDIALYDEFFSEIDQAALL